MAKKNKKKKSTTKKETTSKTGAVCENRKARHDYHILDTYEAGVVLQGCEVKSIREGRMNLQDSFVRISNGEAFLHNCHISPYSHIQGYQVAEPLRTRKLLLKKMEIEKLTGKVSQKGFTIVPLKAYFQRGYLKVLIGVAQGKKQYDKRETLKRKIHTRESQAAVKRMMRS